MILSLEQRYQVAILATVTNPNGSRIYSYRQIARVIGCGKSTVARWAVRYRNGQLLENNDRSGRPRILSAEDIRDLVREVDANPFQTINECINSMPERILAVLRARGGRTRY